jgi:iron complex transport system ATP-binding protein
MCDLLAVNINNVSSGGRSLLGSVRFSLGVGELVVLLGRNGSGKTTLLRAITGLIPSARSSVLFEGTSIASLRAQRLSQCIAYQPQLPPQAFAFTVEEAIRIGGGGCFDAALAAMELESLKNTPVDRLSGGEKQRVALARLLASAAPVWLLDEPLTHLDLRYQRRLIDCLKEKAHAGGGVLVVLHDLALALRCADRVLLLDNGILMADMLSSADALPKLLSDAFQVSDLILI